MVLDILIHNIQFHTAFQGLKGRFQSQKQKQNTKAKTKKTNLTEVIKGERKETSHFTSDHLRGHMCPAILCI